MNPVTLLQARRGLNLLLIFCWMAVIFTGSSVPGNNIPRAVSPYSSFLHMLEYSVLGFLLVPYTGKARSPLVFSILLATAYGLSDELHQLFVPGRYWDVYDLAADCIGSAVGAYLAGKWR